MNEFNAFRLITGLFPHPFLELETSCLETDSSFSELGEGPLSQHCLYLLVD